MVSVRMCVPNLRAKVAGTASLKKNQMCPPLPDRDRSKAPIGKFICRQVSKNAAASILPRRFVEIGGQEVTGLIQQHWIDAHMTKSSCHGCCP